MGRQRWQDFYRHPERSPLQRVESRDLLSRPAAISSGAGPLTVLQVEKMPVPRTASRRGRADSPHILVAVSGAGIVESHGMEPITFATGDAVVIPACVGEYTVRPQWELELMRMSLPAGKIPEPETSQPQSTAAK